MDIQDIRRDRLKAWIKENHGNNVSAFATAASKKQSQIADMLDGRKSFGEKVARSLEATLGMGYLWLDQEDTRGETDTHATKEPAAQYATSPRIAKIITRLVEAEKNKSIPNEGIDAINALLTTFERTTYAQPPENAPGLATDASSKLLAKAVEPTPKQETVLTRKKPAAGRN